MGMDGEPKLGKKTESAPLERIASAAIQYKGEYFTAANHADAWTEMTAKYPEAVLLDAQQSSERVDGFMTNTGRFVGREEALDIAEDAGQLKDYEPHAGTQLWSEDLKKEPEE